MNFMFPPGIDECSKVQDINYLLAMTFLGPYKLTRGPTRKCGPRHISLVLPNRNFTGGNQGKLFSDELYLHYHRVLIDRFNLRSSEIKKDNYESFRRLEATGHSVIRFLRIRQLANPKNWECGDNTSFSSSCTGVFRCLSGRSPFDGHVIGTRSLMGRLGLDADMYGNDFSLSNALGVAKLIEVFPHLGDQHRQLVELILDATVRVQPNHNSVGRAGHNDILRYA